MISKSNCLDNSKPARTEKAELRNVKNGCELENVYITKFAETNYREEHRKVWRFRLEVLGEKDHVLYHFKSSEST